MDDVQALLRAGADKVSVNTSAVKNPELISSLSARFGNQCIVVAVDAKLVDGEWLVHLVGGTVPTTIRLFDWVQEIEQRGAGEILFTSMNHDGTKSGFANEALARISELINLPVIASGGAGNMAHFADAFQKGKADAALAASVFHYKEIEIADLKASLNEQNISVRI